MLFYRYIDCIYQQLQQQSSSASEFLFGIQPPFKLGDSYTEIIKSIIKDYSYFIAFFKSACRYANVPFLPINQKLSTKINAWLEEPTNHLVSILDDNYPDYLQQIDRPPPILFIKSSRQDWRKILLQPALAMVGSRAATTANINLSIRFSQQYARHGWVIVSGLAQGIDYGAHKGALQCAQGSTIAVLGHGLEAPIYPSYHRALASKIMEQGILMSEFVGSTPPYPQNFPQRNRIIAGLSRGLIVVSAKKKSGTLITARYAKDYNREVFAVPGSVHEDTHAGCNQLIRDNSAKMLIEPNDIYDEFQSIKGIDISEENINNSIVMSSPITNSIYNSFANYSNQTFSSLKLKHDISSIDLSSALLELESQGLIKKSFDGIYSLN